MRVFFIVCSLFLTAQFTIGQVNGYLGKKNLVSIFTTTNFRLLPGALLPGDVGGDLGYSTIKYDEHNVRKIGNKIARYDLRVSYSRELTSRFALGAEFGYEKLIMTNKYSTDLSSTPVFNVTSYMLTFGFSKKNSLNPVGFCTTLGVGPRVYAFDRNENYRLSTTEEMIYPMPDYRKNIMGVNFFVQISDRILLTRFLVLDVGVRFQTGFALQNGLGLEGGQYSKETQQYIVNSDGSYQYPEWTKSALVGDLSMETATNLISFRIGLGYLF